jgi:hypothetical protein
MTFDYQYNLLPQFIFLMFFLGLKLLHWIHEIYEVFFFLTRNIWSFKSCYIDMYICYFIQSFGYTDIARSQWRTLCRLFSCWGTKLLEILNHCSLGIKY